jgi:hypothetical protein
VDSISVADVVDEAALKRKRSLFRTGAHMVAAGRLIWRAVAGSGRWRRGELVLCTSWATQSKPTVLADFVVEVAAAD